MSDLFKRTFCLYMVIQVLFSSMGIAIYEHNCLIKGTKTHSLLQGKICRVGTPASSGTKPECDYQFTRSKCCLDKVSYCKVQTPSAEVTSLHFLSLSIAQAFIFTPIYCPSTVWAYQSVSFLFDHLYSSAPPLYGRKMLVFVQSFLI